MVGRAAESGVALVAHFLHLGCSLWVGGERGWGGLRGEGDEGSVQGGQVDEVLGEVGLGGAEGFGGWVEG